MQNTSFTTSTAELKEPTPQDFGITDEELDLCNTITSPWQAITHPRKAFRFLQILDGPFRKRLERYESARKAYFNAKSHAQMKLLLELQEVHRAERERKAAVQKAEQERKEAEQAARKAAQRKHIRFWQSLSGVQFEKELADLYRQRNYKVELTPISGDDGIDLILKKGDKTVIVQCKRFKNPAGPATVRELYGAFAASDATEAVLACTGGFTTGVYDFAEGKPIRLIGMPELIQMATGEMYEPPKASSMGEREVLCQKCQVEWHSGNFRQCATCYYKSREEKVLCRSCRRNKHPRKYRVCYPCRMRWD